MSAESIADVWGNAFGPKSTDHARLTRGESPESIDGSVHRFKSAMKLSKINGPLASLTVILGLAVLGLSLFVFMRVSSRRLRAEMPVLGKVPDFALTERDGQTVRLSDLQERVWVVDFIFTSCPGPCPRMTSQMRRLQDDFAGKKDIRLVSVTVDPETDTPAVLSKYASAFGAHRERWLFLTGPRDAIRALATNGLHLAVQDNQGPDRDPEAGLIIHSTRFVLIDRKGRIRGYYDSADDDSMRRLRAGMGVLLKEKSI